MGVLLALSLALGGCSLADLSDAFEKTPHGDISLGSGDMSKPEGMLTDLLPSVDSFLPLKGGSSRLTNGGRAVADDDGELHVGWDDTVGWSFEEETFEVDKLAKPADYALGLSANLNVYVAYPQLVDAGEHAEAINAALRDVAMDTVDRYLVKPSDETREMMRELGRANESYVYDTVLEDEVTWAICYNTSDFVSVAFSDVSRIGSWDNSFILLRCVNANLKTGEVYQVDDVLEVNEDIASAFVDAMVANSGTDVDGDGVVSDDECDALAIADRASFVQGILGKGDFARRMSTTFFVDEAGRPNLGVNYWVSNGDGWVRGWWDATLSDQLLEGARKDSSFWGLVP